MTVQGLIFVIQNDGKWQLFGDVHNNNDVSIDNYKASVYLDATDSSGYHYGAAYQGSVWPKKTDGPWTTTGWNGAISWDWNAIEQSKGHCYVQWGTDGWATAGEVLGFPWY